ncbi:MATE family efflux transporter [Motilimonas sp. KMU-193]|uniref:MATE family efflux transporter n=1 Tax=Motilimonas sp. KMU-193 TaxID=3388668 RepID=UPI00396B4177
MSSYKQELSHLVKLSWPILIAQIAMTTMGFIDTVMAGKVSATDMAAVAVASSFWIPAILLLQGLIMAVTPIVSHLNGGKKRKQIPFSLMQALWLALVLSALLMLALYYSPWVLIWMDVEPELARLTKGYLHAVIWGIPPFALYLVLRSLCDGLSRTVPSMMIGFVGLAVNIPANYIFIFGKFGMPALGGIGCGVATALVYLAMGLAMLAYVLLDSEFKPLHPFRRLIKPNIKQMKRIFKLGFPVAAATFFEVTLFTVVALLLAPMGPLVVSSHQIAINYSSMVFMIPLSIGIAASIRVGHSLGERKPEQAKVAANTAIMFGLAIAVVTATFSYVFRQQIASFYTDETAVIELAVSLLVLACIYQFSDTIQVIIAGILRGYKDTQVIFYITLVSFWMIGLPLGYSLASGINLLFIDLPTLGAKGYWIGFIAGLTAAAILLSFRLAYNYRQSAKLVASAKAISQTQV